MTTANISQTRFEPILQTFEKMSNSDLEFMQKTVAHILVGRKLKVFYPRELELLDQINEPPFKPSEQKRYDFLYKKLQNEKISTKQHTELLQMIDKMEDHNVRRLELLMELSQLRNTSLREIMRQLDITEISNYG